ncbi:hypothetical protein [Streptomyces griseoaurantiacus]|uniref:hypothetical protein n=1 Tax=Streptomyces griseoaurantiacus TaxID=68213 RepID=UPI0030E17238
MAVLRPAGGSGVLALDPGGGGALLDEPGVVDDQHAVVLAELAGDVFLQVDEALEAAARAERAGYVERQRLTDQREAVRAGFREADELSWSTLLGGREPAVEWRRRSVWEGATAETYIAVEASDPVLRGVRD